MKVSEMAKKLTEEHEQEKLRKEEVEESEEVSNLYTLSLSYLKTIQLQPPVLATAIPARPGQSQASKSFVKVRSRVLTNENKLFFSLDVSSAPQDFVRLMLTMHPELPALTQLGKVIYFVA